MPSAFLKLENCGTFEIFVYMLVFVESTTHWLGTEHRTIVLMYTFVIVIV